MMLVEVIKSPVPQGKIQDGAECYEYFINGEVLNSQLLPTTVSADSFATELGLF